MLEKTEFTFYLNVEAVSSSIGVIIHLIVNVEPMANTAN